MEATLISSPYLFGICLQRSFCCWLYQQQHSLCPKQQQLWHRHNPTHSVTVPVSGLGLATYVLLQRMACCCSRRRQAVCCHTHKPGTVGPGSPAAVASLQRRDDILRLNVLAMSSICCSKQTRVCELANQRGNSNNRTPCTVFPCDTPDVFPASAAMPAASLLPRYNLSTQLQFLLLYDQNGVF